MGKPLQMCVSWIILCLFTFLLHFSRVSTDGRNDDDARRQSECDFNLKTCQWKTGHVWSWVKPTVGGVSLDGPPDGVSGESALLAHLKPSSTGHSAAIQLESPTFNTSQRVSCFSFAYYLVDEDGENTLQLTVGGGSEIWSVGSARSSDRWFRGQAEIEQQVATPFKLQFVASGNSGFVALQNFQFRQEACQYEECTFESGNCGWTPKDDAPFKVVQAKMTNESARGDHTSHSPAGHVMLFSASGEVSEALLLGPKVEYLYQQCVTFWYLRTGPLSNVLFELASIHISALEVIWSSSGIEPLEEWNRVQVKVDVFQKMQLAFRIVSKEEGGTIEIDDISINVAGCSDAITCAFEETDGVCGWTEHSGMDDLLWTQGAGRVVNASHLSIANVSFGKGRFLYSDFTTIRRPSRMQLISEVVPSPPLGGACVNLYYLVASLDSPTDSFTLQQIDSAGHSSVLWKFTQTDNSMGTFQTASIYVPNPPQNSSYRLALVAQSAHPSTYIAISKVEYSTGPLYCKKGFTTTPSPSTLQPTTLSPSASADCDFEHGTLCGWSDVPVQYDAHFKVFTPGMAIASMRDDPFCVPQADRTTGTSEGHFAYQYSLYERSEGTLTAVNPYPGSSICFSFWYYLYTDKPSSLTVTLDLNSEKSSLAYRSTDSNDLNWKYVSFTIAFNETYSNLTFRSDLDSGGLALDDITITRGSCRSSYDDGDRCEFESGRPCLLKPTYSSTGIQWRLYPASQFGLVDHTTHDSDGHFFGLDVKSVVTSKPTQAETFYLETGLLSAQRYSCFQFAYYLDSALSPDVTLFYDVTYDAYAEPIGWQVAASTMGRWFTHRAKIPFKANNFNVKMGVTVPVNGGGGGVFIDDVIFSSGNCQSPNGCDFEDGNTCTLETVRNPDPTHLDELSKDVRGYLSHNKIGTQMTVKYLNGETQASWHVFSPHLQPHKYVPTDHSLKSSEGIYLLLTGSGLYDRGIMATERYPLSESGFICLSLAVYKTDTHGLNVLEVYQGESLDTEEGTKLWDISRPTKGWEVFNIKAAPRNNQSVDLFFWIVGTIGAYSDEGQFIAIDDFFIGGDCTHPSNVLPTVAPSIGTTTESSLTTVDPNLFICKSGKRISVEKTCDWVNDCEKGEDEQTSICGSCNFSNHNLCRYDIVNHFSNDAFTFNFSDSVSVAPSTGSHENALFMIASGRDVTGTTSLVSPLIHQAYAYCSLNFAYRSNYTPKKTLLDFTLFVYLQFEDIHTKVLIWESDYTNLGNDEWTPIELNIGRIVHPYRVVFKVTSDFESPQVYNALDDIRLKSCQPETPSKGDCFLAFKCANSVCAPKEKVCDFEDDCGDGSDELNCDPKKRTDFEGNSGFGRWEGGSSSGWSLTKASSMARLRSGPTYDQTTGYSTGSYMMTKKIAEIRSAPLMAPAKKGCQLTLYFFKNSQDSALVVTLTNLKTGEKNSITRLKGVTHSWERQYLYLDIWDDPVQVTLAAFFDGKDTFTTPYIAIDDIAFDSNCQILDSLPANVTTVKPNACPTVTCPATASNTTLCLKPEQYCNFVADCANGIDEKYCGDCTLEEGNTCQWTTFDQEIEHWTVLKPASSAPGELAKVDADSKSTGAYLTISRVNNPSTSQYATLRSPRINAQTSVDCKLQFAFFSKHGVSLQVKMVERGWRNPIFKEKKMSPKWTTVTVDIGAHRHGFAIDLEVAGGGITNGKYKDVAVDNLRLVNCDPKKPVVPTGSKSISCDFETDLCGWEVSGGSGNGARSKWERTNDQKKQPGSDHTRTLKPKPRLSGTWLTSQATEDGSKEADYLQTSVQLKAGQLYCFTFWAYFFTLDASSSLSLNVVSSLASVSSQILWFRNIPQSRNWNEHSVEIPSQQANFTLLFTGKVSPTSVMGLDDFTLANGSCPVRSNGFCDFEVNFCDWKPQNGGWQRNEKILPFPDHSTGTVYGHSLQATSSPKKASIRKKIDSLRPFHSRFQRSRPYCLQLYYFWDVEEGRVDSSSVLSLTVTDHQTTPNHLNLSLLDTFNSGALKQWTPLEFDFRAIASAVVNIDCMIEKEGNSLWLDDISIRKTACGEMGNCDFETDLCGWENVGVVSSSRRFLWLRIQPSSPFLSGTFIHYDHSTNSATGNYLLWPTQVVDRSSSVLKSPLLYRKKSASGSLCFSLYYFALSSSSGIRAFTVQLDDLSLKKAKNLVVAVNATERLEWTQFHHQFDNLPSVFQLSIETVYNGNLLSDIGIDDIKLQFGPCSGANQPTPAPSPATPLPPTEQELDCNFDQNTCNWTFDKAAWNVTDFSDQREYYAPQGDHTYEMAKGKYLLFTKSTAKNATSFAITSKVAIPYNRDHCLTFWYFEDGEDQFTVQVLERLPKNPIDVHQFNSAIESRRRWRLVKADIPFSLAYNVSEIKLSLLYQPSSLRLGQFSVFALDDIKLRPWRCSHEYDYTYTFAIGYEDLELSFIQPLIGGLGTLDTPASSGHRVGSPTVDHTTNSNKGTYFLFMNDPKASAPTTYISKLTMVDIARDGSEDSCVRFAYQTKGNALMKVYVINADAQLDTSQMKPFWTTNYAKDSWTIAEFNKHLSYKHKVIFYLEKPADNSSLVALDDLEVLRHQCQAPVNCDFDGHFCTYTPYMSQFRFGLFTAPKQDPGWPGPEFDHSTGRSGGGYLYLTAYRSIGTFTQLVSKVISGARKVAPTSTYCLSLWTQLTTPDLELRVHLVHFGPSWLDGNRSQEILHISGVNQSDWTQLQVTLDPTVLLNTFEVQLIIEGRIGTNSRGAIAVDDITLTDGVCQVGGLICENGIQLKKDKICNFVKDCPSGLDEVNCGDSCDFESPSGSCGWINALGVAQKWSIVSASKAGNVFAPSFDASSSFNGHYLLMGQPSTGLTSNAEIALNYPNPALYLKNAFHSCVLTFDYFVNSTSKYIVDVRFGPDTDSWSTVYRIVHIPTGGWRKAFAHIGAHYTPFMADIRGTLLDATLGAIALDNVAFVNCSLPAPLLANQSCNANQYLCKEDRFCIDTSDVCNWVPDCPDGSDESACKEYPNGCNFEETLYTCGITTDSAIGEENVHWAIRSGKYSPDSFFPKIDNTKRLSSGQFIGLSPKLSGHHSSTNIARFYSPMMSSKIDSKCQLRFFYFINDEPFKIQFTQLSVSVWFANKLTPEAPEIGKYSLDINDEAQQKWNKALVGYTSSEPFRFVFTGFLGSNAARIALDDISYDDNCVPSTVQPLTPTTTTKTPSTVTPNSDISTTLIPLKHLKPKSNGKGGIIAAVLVPVFLVFGIVLGFFAYRRYKASKGTEENLTLSMMDIMRRSKN